MSKKEEQESSIIVAWSMTVIQSMNALPDTDAPPLNVLQSLAEKIIQGLTSKGEIAQSVEDYLEIYDVPEIIFHLSEDNTELQVLNKRIKSLSPEFIRLLHYLALGHEPDNICLSMEYNNQAEFWKKREACLSKFLNKKEVFDTVLIDKLLQVYNKYTLIRDNYLKTTEILEKGEKKRKTTRNWFITGILAIVVPSVFYFFVYPQMIQKDPVELFNYAIDKSGLEIPIDSIALIDDLLLEEESFSPESYWLMALKALQLGDPDECKAQLKTLKSADKKLFAERGRYIYRRL